MPELAGERLARALFSPTKVALIGASADPAKTASRPQRYLRKHGFAGEIYPVNPGRTRIFGEPALASPAQLPDGVEHACILLPTEAVEAAVAACAERGVACASILAGGFAEAGPEGLARQRRIRETAARHGMRLLGPNCIGVINPVDGIVLSASAVLEVDALLPGRLGLVSQSGSLLGALLSRGQASGLGFSRLISVGNEADLGLGEIADLLVDDAATDVILLFLESVRDAERIEVMAGRAHAAGKPVIAYKLGRSDVGAELATSHTGALAGDDAAVDAFLDAAGIVRVDLFESLLEAAQLASGKKPTTRPGRAVAVVTTSGGGGAMVVDRLGLAGLDVPAPPEELRRKLAEQNISIGPGRLIDVTMAGARPEVYGTILRELMLSDYVDAVVAVVGSSAEFHPELAVQPIVDLKKRPKPLAVFLAPHADASARQLAAAGIASFRTPESAADAMAAVLRRHPPIKVDRPPFGDLDRVGALIAEGSFNEDRALMVFEALSVPRIRSVVLSEHPLPDDLTEIDFYPVAVKVLSPDIAHKSEAGGVILGVEDAEALSRACRELVESANRHHADARIDGIIVQAMASGMAEMLIGYRRDPQVGPLAVVGMGGLLAEVVADVRVARAPLSLETARSMIASLKGMPLLRGFRGRPPADVEALARALAALSDLARVPEAGVTEAEVNPLIVGAEGEGVVAVDGLIVTGSGAGGVPSPHQPTA